MNDASTAFGEVDFRTAELLADLPEHLHIQQFYLGCLSQAAYLIGDRSSGRAVVIDPRRDIAEVLEAAAEANLAIEWVIETHFHADFLSGHLELAAATGAKIALSSLGETEFESTPLHDGQIINLGRVNLEVWQTPGHTPESITLIVRADAGAQPLAAVTGDTLFIGDVGRPDLLSSLGKSANELGAMLYDSVNRLLRLDDDVLVLPGHGAGSACGKALSTETASHMGIQRLTNYALQPMSEQAFVDIVTEGQPTAPGYFVYDAVLNRKDRALLDESKAVPSLTIDEALARTVDGAVLLDVRAPETFTTGHVVGSINVGLGGRFAEMVGSVIAVGTPIVVIGDGDMSTEAVIRLARIGIDTVIGAVAEQGGAAPGDGSEFTVEGILIQRPELAQRASRMTAADFKATKAGVPDIQIIDIRNPSETEHAPVDGSTPIPLPTLGTSIETLNPDLPTVLFCAGGYRSSIAASFLRSRGFTDVSDVIGGAGAILATA